ncbi:VanZ family protein [Listeria cornellensis]|uniref:VanZ-like domain-containing protein n=1 Tax=Listeria cornellensis FSL F6-0969 TaxID=1265820 RepID=W7CG80_9LIST|nr:VanZ family protein [Listeria cornellensis]EUJ31888.1 hypothetical protein PCORN_03538 [Listeria cornellensis FSL F6-0969]
MPIRAHLDIITTTKHIKGDKNDRGTSISRHNTNRIHYFFCSHGSEKKETIKRIIFKSIMLIYIVGVVGYTIFPILIDREIGGGGATIFQLGVNIIPFAAMGDIYTQMGDGGRNHALYQVIGNIIMFIPLGCLYPLCSKCRVSWKRMFWISLSASLFIELSQLAQNIVFQTAFRSADIDDVILNVSGGFIGYALFRLCKPLFKKMKLYNF